MIEVYTGNCLDTLPTLKGRRIDMCWTDPPYNVKKDYGIYKDDLPDNEYLAFTQRWIDMVRELTPNIAVFVPTKYILQYWQMLGSDFRQIILSWSPEGTFRYGFVNQFSSILTNVKPLERTRNVWHNCQMTGQGYFFREKTYGHPGYTSEDITRRVLQAFTRPGDVVLDPFSGTGTTMLVAKALGRKAIGIELNPAYTAILPQRSTQIPMGLFDDMSFEGAESDVAV